MVLIDNKKAYGMVPQRWIIDCLKMYKVSDEDIKFIENTIENWRVKVIAVGKSLAERENPEMNLPGRSAITDTFCNSDDTNQSHS